MASYGGGAQAPTNLAKQPAPNKAPAGGGEKRYWNAGSKRMETAQQIRGYKAPGAHTRVSAAAKAMGAPTQKAAPAKAPQSPYIGGQIVDTLGMLTRGQKQAAAGGINEAERGRNQNIMETYGAKNRELGNAEGTTANRLTGINQGAQGALGGLLQGAEGSAKTADNATAERALSAEKAIETTGQNMATSSGGYLDPQIRAQIEAGGQNFANILAGNAAGTQARGELGVNDIRTLAASNVARGQENQAELRNRFYGERQKNTAAQNAELGRSAAKAKEERITLPKELYADILAQNKLRQAGELGAAKIGSTERKNTITARGQTLNREGRAETNATGLKKVALQQAGARERGELNNQERREVANQTNAYRYAALGEKSRLDEANIAYKARDLQIKAEANALKGKGGVKMTAPALKQYTTEFSQALSAFENAGIEAGAKKLKAPNYNEVRANLARGYKSLAAEEGGKSSLKKIPSVTNRIILQAAEEVWRTHYVSKNTAKALESIGLPGSGWNATLKRG